MFGLLLLMCVLISEQSSTFTVVPAHWRCFSLRSSPACSCSQSWSLTFNPCGDQLKPSVHKIVNLEIRHLFNLTDLKETSPVPECNTQTWAERRQDGRMKWKYSKKNLVLLLYYINLTALVERSVSDQDSSLRHVITVVLNSSLFSCSN